MYVRRYVFNIWIHAYASLYVCVGVCARKADLEQFSKGGGHVGTVLEDDEVVCRRHRQVGVVGGKVKRLVCGDADGVELLKGKISGALSDTEEGRLRGGEGGRERRGCMSVPKVPGI